MNQTARTAIARRGPSAPARWLASQGFIAGRGLDYGCGRGADAREYGLDAYDPYYVPQKPQGSYDTILCTYVLNVVSEEEAQTILSEIRGHLAPGGCAYVTVRRDFKDDYTTKRGVTQRLVTLDLPVLRSCAGYCTYTVRSPEAEAEADERRRAMRERAKRRRFFAYLLQVDYVNGIIDSLPPEIWTPELRAERLSRDVL